MRVKILVILLVLIAGCTGHQAWSVSINGHVDDNEDTRRFIGEIELGGKSGGVSIEGIQIEFVDSDKQVVETVHIKRLNSTRGIVNINISLSQTIHAVTINIETVDAPESSICTIIGLERQNGELVPSHQTKLTDTSKTPSHSCFKN